MRVYESLWEFMKVYKGFVDIWRFMNVKEGLRRFRKI